MTEQYGINQSEIEQGKAMAGLSYLGFPGFLVAIVTSRENRFVLFHAQQSLVLMICWMLMFFIWPFALIPFLGLLFLPMWFLLAVALIVLLILGSLHGFNGHVKTLPVIGAYGFRLALFHPEDPGEENRGSGSE